MTSRYYVAGIPGSCICTSDYKEASHEVQGRRASIFQVFPDFSSAQKFLKQINSSYSPIRSFHFSPRTPTTP